jgi:hypothetical protein
MSKAIKSYEDLLQEEQRLMKQLKTHEELIKEDFAGLKENLKPVSNVFKVFNKMATRDNTGPILNFSLDLGVDLVIRKWLLAKAGWFTKIVVPFVVKNYSSHIISEEKRAKLLKKVQNILNKIRPNKDSKKADHATS